MNDITNHFAKLQPSEQLELLKKLEARIGGETKLLNVAKDNNHHTCTRCNSNKVILAGTFKSKQRFKCKDCKKTFSTFTGTSVYCIKKKDLWMSFVRMSLENRTIRQMAKDLQLSTATVFNWRHKLLGSLKETFQREFKGIVETDDIYFPFSQKGRKKGMIKMGKRKRGVSNDKVSVMFITDRYKTLGMKIVKRGRITKDDLNRMMPKHRFNQDNIVCSDTHWSICSFVRDMQLKHITVKALAKEYVKSDEPMYHIQTINNLASRFKRWLNKNFINVSTKYLQNYLNWFMFENTLNKDGSLENVLEYSLKDIEAHTHSRTYEQQYNGFLSLSNGN